MNIKHEHQNPVNRNNDLFSGYVRARDSSGHVSFDTTKDTWCLRFRLPLQCGLSECILEARWCFTHAFSADLIV